MGATVWPLVTNQVAPRQTSRPPSVTMNEGTFRKAMMMPCSAPIEAPTAMPTTSVTIQIIGLPAPR